MKRSEEIINKALNEMLERAAAIAKQDGVITDDEKEFLEDLEVCVKLIDFGSFKVLDSNLSEIEFRDLLTQLHAQILEKMTEVKGKKRRKLTETQKELLSRVIDAVIKPYEETLS